MNDACLFKEEVFIKFASNPCGKTAYELILASKEELNNIASHWNSQGLSMVEKIRELICEMFLALLEDFQANIKFGYGSVVSFIRKRLLRITRQRVRSFVDIDSEQFEEPEDKGRINLTSEKLQQTDIMVNSIREIMLSSNEEAGILYFLFVHIYPDIMWASHYLTEKYGGDKLLRVATDRKRLYRFNAKLRDSLKENPEFDYNDILTWERGERNYLAWRLISIAPSELYNKGCISDLDVINNWHDEFNKQEHYSEEKLLSVKNIFNSMQKKWYSSHKSDYIEEETAIYGKVPSILEMVLGVPQHSNLISLNEPSMSAYGSNSISDGDFDLVAEELSEWFNKIYISRRLKTEN